MREALKQDLILDEGLKLKPYEDTMGKLTIGVGRNLDDVGISREEALRLLDADLTRVEGDLDKHFAWWRSKSDSAQRALANMTFQMGIGGISKFNRMLACLQAGDYAGARREALDSSWAKQVPARAERVVSLFTDKET